MSLSITWPWEEITVCCMGQQRAGKYLGQLKPWEGLSNRNSGQSYSCSAPSHCVDIVRDVFLWETCWSSAFLMLLNLQMKFTLAGVLVFVVLTWAFSICPSYKILPQARHCLNHLTFVCQQSCCWTNDMLCYSHATFTLMLQLLFSICVKTVRAQGETIKRHSDSVCACVPVSQYPDAWAHAFSK